MNASCLCHLFILTYTGEVQYQARIDDIRLLRVKVKELVRENSLTKNNTHQLDDFKKEILQLQRELLQEKTKVTALSEELENPMNVHRWRKLEGSDPATFELIQKIQTLQRRLIAKTEEVVEKGLIIEEKEKLYEELKTILARQPGPEISEQLSVYQQNLKKKNIQLKAMASELNMYQAQVNEFKYEQERVTRELTEMKRKYYQQKRKDKLLEDMQYDEEQQLLRNNVNPLSAAQQGHQNMLMDANAPPSFGVQGTVETLRSKTTPTMIKSQQVATAKNSRTRFTGGGYAVK